MVRDATRWLFQPRAHGCLWVPGQCMRGWMDILTARPVKQGALTDSARPAVAAELELARVKPLYNPSARRSSFFPAIGGHQK